MHTPTGSQVLTPGPVVGGGSECDINNVDDGDYDINESLVIIDGGGVHGIDDHHDDDDDE